MKGIGMYRSLDVVVGGQYGSESKGRVAAELVRQRAAQSPDRRVLSVRVGGPNAGHVVVADNGRTYAMRQIPVGFVDPHAVLFIAAGSEVDAEVLTDEIQILEDDGIEVRSRLFIDPQATLLEPHHRNQEQLDGLNERTGSTAKGVGAARAERIWRKARLVSDAPELFPNVRIMNVLSPSLDAPVVLEGTQGYGLGLHAGHYPQCTSNDTRAIDFLSQAGINPWDVHYARDNFHVHVVVRPNPIRVAGNSGPMKGETTWEELGLEPELTTVTKKVRRVGSFDFDLVGRAIAANGRSAVRVHLAMADRLDNEAMIALVEQIRVLAPVVALGTGPHATEWINPQLVFGDQLPVEWEPQQYEGDDDMKDFQD